MGPLAEEATIDAKSSFTIALLLNYYLVIGRSSRENEQRNSIKARELLCNEARQTPLNVKLRKIQHWVVFVNGTLLCSIDTRNFVSSFGYVIDFIPIFKHAARQITPARRVVTRYDDILAHNRLTLIPIPKYTLGMNTDDYISIAHMNSPVDILINQ